MNKKIVAVSQIALAIAGLTVLTASPARALESTSQPSQTIGRFSEASLYAQAGDDDDDDDDDDDEIELSSTLRRTILESVASQIQASVNELEIVAARQETWSDTCLGLGGPAMSCGQTMVPGYLVVVTRGNNNYVYRINESGDVAVLDQAATASLTVRTTTVEQTTTGTSQTTTQSGSSQSSGSTVVQGSSSQTEVSVRETSFSQTVQTAVFQAIAQRYQVSTSSLRVVEVRRRVWANGCLGLSIPGRACTEATVPGYLVVTRSGEQIYVYRTDITGSTVVLDEAATELRTAQLRVRNARITFSDVSANYWAAEYISQLAALNIIDGYPDGTYRPDQRVTRAEFAAIIRRAFEVSEVREAINFLDVQRSYWAYTAIQESYQMGFLSGSASNLFQPVASLTRGDVLFALARGLRFTTSSSVQTLLANYTDVTISSEETRTLLAALTEQGVVVNYPNVRSLSLERTITRAEVAVTVYQTLVSLGRVEPINSPYVVPGTDVIEVDDDGNVEVDRDDDDDDDDDTDRSRQNCNQGIGNGAEGCDPGNSAPRGGSNDEGGRTPGGRTR
jgi:S-layer homology domain